MRPGAAWPIVVCALIQGAGLAQGTVSGTVASERVAVLMVQGVVEVARSGQGVWDLASTREPYCVLNPGDRIRTQDRSRAAVRLRDLTVVQLGPHSQLEVLPRSDPRSGFILNGGRLYLFHRDRPGEFQLRTPMASPVIRGTEFVIEVDADGTTTLQLVEGEAALASDWGEVVLESGEAGRAGPNEPPVRIPARAVADAIQWCLYYPAVLDLDELALDEGARGVLADSMGDYRLGDVAGALARYPRDRSPGSDAERIYVATLLLAVGDASGAEGLLSGIEGGPERLEGLVAAVRTLMAATRFEARPASGPSIDSPRSASMQLADSYYRQSVFDLEGASRSARAAVECAPRFAFGWARLAELEFGFGRTRAAAAAVGRALELAPRQPQALALCGFLEAARARFAPARLHFENAIALDGALGNAWLGRGLCRIRGGDAAGGRGDLLVAAALEPNRALLRSYLGKVFSETGADVLARRELEVAMGLDPMDPTAWLYRALSNQRGNRLNDAIRDLEHSQELNDNRRLYRSRLLLDQDRAVRQANLAAAFRDAGLLETAVREAGRAVGTDYANYSAHLFLANSYAQSREPTWANLRHETAMLSEYLTAYLLAPVGGGTLSPTVSQQEYARFFDRQGLGVSSWTQYLSRGDWQQRGVQYGALDGFDYALDAYYLDRNGEGPNQDMTLEVFSGAFKQQLGPQDTVYIQAQYGAVDSGDVRQQYDPDEADPDLRIREIQAPTLLAGIRHEWGPGSQTLLLAGYLRDDFRLRDSDEWILTLWRTADGSARVVPEPLSLFDVRQNAEFDAGSIEVQHIAQQRRHTVVVGARYQGGGTDTEVALANPPTNLFNLQYPDVRWQVGSDFNRVAVYGYEHWEIADGLWLVGGLCYDWLAWPENIDLPPISDGQRDTHQISPKAGAVWQPGRGTVVRAAYTRSLGGLYQEQSVRLEPTQVAGFNQAFRSLIPESVAGLAPGAEAETWGVDLSQRIGAGTYVGLAGEWLRADASRTVGVFVRMPGEIDAAPSSTAETLDFEERSLTANVNQLLGRDWALGVRYRVSEASLDRALPAVPVEALRTARQSETSRLQEVALSLNYAHASGWFGQASAHWYGQHNASRNTAYGSHPDDAFWQLDVAVGYRFARRRAEVMLGVLNLAAQDYRLYALNLYPGLPRERTLMVTFKFNF